MKKIILATAAGVSLLATGLIAVPAHADEWHPGGVGTTLTDLNDTTGISVPSDIPVQTFPYKAVFNWTIPTNDAGSPYTSCTVQFLRENGSVALEAPYPASVTTLSLPFSATEMTDEPAVPGETTLDLNYQCTNDAGDLSDWQSITSEVIPDVAPTAPTKVDVTASVGALNVQYGGSEAIGVAPLEGYQIDVLSGDKVVSSTTSAASAGGSLVVGGSAAHSTLTAGSKIVKAAAVAPTAKRYSALATSVSNLPAGLYTVKVAGFNAVGLSTAVTKEIIVSGNASNVALVKAPGKVQSLKAKVAKTSAVVSWKAPANAAAKTYTIKISGNGKVKTYSVGSKTSLKITGLKKNTRYNVWVTATGSMKTLTSLTPGHFTTAKR